MRGMRPRGRVGLGPSRRMRPWDGVAIWVGMLSVTPCVLASGAPAVPVVLSRVKPPPQPAARSWPPRPSGW
jgi:hypothetical protein